MKKNLLLNPAYVIASACLLAVFFQLIADHDRVVDPVIAAGIGSDAGGFIRNEQISREIRKPMWLDTEHDGKVIHGEASWYDYNYKGVAVTKSKLVCATRDFKRGSFVRATDDSTGRSVTCKVTDYGPDQSSYPERVIDLGSFAFSQIAPLSQGDIKKITVTQYVPQ